MKNKINKTNCEFTIKEKDDKNIFILNKKNENIIFYDSRIVEKVFEDRFQKKYLEILKIISELESDDSSDYQELALLKIDELRNLVFNKYFKYLNKNTIGKYLKILAILEEKVNLYKRGKSR